MCASVHADVKFECCKSLADAVSHRHKGCIEQLWEDANNADKVSGWNIVTEAMKHAALSGDTVGMAWLFDKGARLEASVTRELGRRGQLETLKVAYQTHYPQVLEAAAEGAGGHSISNPCLA